MKTKIKKEDSPLVWKAHVRNMFDELLQCGESTRIFDKPFRITMRILGAMAEHAAEVNDEVMIGYLCRFAIYNFSNPTNLEEFDQERTDYYVRKTIKPE